MRSINKVIIVICLILFVCFTYNNFFLKSMLVGKYENVNYAHDPFIPEIPYKYDVLTLFDDKHFTSSFWGNGTYKILYNAFGTKIELTYTYQFGKGIFVGSVDRIFFGKPKLILDRERNHYFEMQ